MEYIFHEKQEGHLCAQHCLNSLLQGDYYSAVDLATIAHQLDNIEHKFMSEAGTSSKDYLNFLSQESSNYDDSGYFSIQVLQEALKSWSLELIPFSSQNEFAQEARLNPINQKAYICHFKHHWYTIRKIGNYWFNLNSILSKPQLITDTYLSVLLAQLQAEGYSIFIVSGELPKSPADMHLAECTLNVKEILSNYNKKRDYAPSNEDFDEDELKKAIKMSLAENDLDFDYQSAGPSLAHQSTHSNEEEEFEKAIRMSLEGAKSSDANNKSTEEPKEVLSIEEIRKRRLEKFSEKK
jgi:ataxin-3